MTKLSLHQSHTALHLLPSASPNAVSRALRSVAALPLRIYLHTYHRLRIVGREHLPSEGSFIIVANHASHLDALCLRAAIPRSRLHCTFSLAAHDYFFAKMRRLLPAIVFANAIPFGRNTRLREGLDLCRQVVAVPGNVLVLFPEGTRTTTGRIGKFRPGVGVVVAGTDLPVVPCALQGTFLAWPKGRWFPHPRALRLVIGSPRQYSDLPISRESSDWVAHDLQTAVQELLCQ